MPSKKITTPPRTPRHPVSCRKFSKLCCADFRAVLNRRFRRDNRKHLRESPCE